MAVALPLALVLFAWVTYSRIDEGLEVALPIMQTIGESGRQRVLLQRSAYFASLLVANVTEESRSDAARQLELVLARLETAHEVLKPERAAFGRNGRLAATEAADDYKRGRFSLDQLLGDYIAAARALLAAPHHTLGHDHPDFVRLGELLTMLNEIQNAAANRHDALARARIAAFAAVNRQSLAIIVLCFAGVGVLAVRSLAWRADADEAMRAVRLSEARFRSLSEFAPIGIFLDDARGNCTYTNPRWWEISGLDFEATAGSGWTRAIHPDDTDRVFSGWQAALGAGSEFSCEFRIRRPDGSIRWVDSRAAPIEIDGDPQAGYVGTIADITEQRATAARLRESEERFALAIRGADDGIWDWDLVADKTYYSPRFEALLGYEENTLPQTFASFEAALHPQDKARVLAAVDAHLEARVPYRLEYRLKTKSGEYSWFSAAGQAEWDPTGKALRFAGSIRDITAQRKLEQDLRLTQASVDKAAEAVFWTDTDGRFVYANSATRAALGYSSRELLRMRVSDIDLTLDQSDWRKRRRVSKRIDILKHETAFRRRDGSEFPVEVIENFIEFEDKKFIMCFAIDITERRRNEDAEHRYIAELRRANAAVAEHAAQLEAQTAALTRSNEELEQFAYISSHDLQEPLRKIQAFGDRLIRHHADVLGESGTSDLERMRSAAKRMQTLIEDLLLYSRITRDPAPFVSVDLNKIVAEVLTDLEALIEAEQGEIKLGNLPTIPANPTQMRQLFQNLIGNALKFHAPGERPVVEICAAQSTPAEGYTITVIDNGIGIEQQYAEKIFAPFQRLHGRNEFAGTGIGLAVVKKIVDCHGGHVGVVPTAGGTTFVVWLPHRPPGESRPAAAAAACEPV